jgi:Zn-dependent M28 family amino/carboxypeptidase
VQLVLDRKPVLVKTRNVLAQTKTGATDNVVMVGAHLDSPPASAGINDNATGVAALLETAAALGAEPQSTNAVRFAFWGSEEYALSGASKYVRGLDDEHLDDIALYLEADMIGSSNAGYFTYDGDQSGQANPAIPVGAVPAGSAGIERMLAGYLNLAGVRPADIQLARNTDYNAFLSAGVPVGGLTTGASQRKTQAQARLWGGRAGVPFDPDFRTPRDNVDGIDRQALSVMGSALAFAVGTYAKSVEGVNGVPPRGERHRRAP